MKTKSPACRYGLVAASALAFMLAAHALRAQQSQIDQGFCNINFQDGLTNAKHVVSVKDLNTELQTSFSRKGIKDFKTANTETLKQAVVEGFNYVYGTARSKFRLKRVHVDEAKNHHYILNQFIEGVPVMGSTVAIHMTGGGELYEVTGQYLSGTAPSVAIHIDTATAVMAAKKILKDSSTLNTKKGPALVIAGNKLTWRMYIHEPGADGTWDMLVDAQTEEVLQKRTTVVYYSNPPGFPDSGSITQINGNKVMREGGVPCTVSVWKNDYTNLKYTINDDVPNKLYWVILDHSVDTTTGYPVDTIFSSSLTDWDTTNRPIVSLAHNIQTTMAFVRDSFGWNSYDNSGSILKCFLCHKDDIPGPKWDPINEYMYIDLGKTNTAEERVNTEIVAHEFGHAVIQHAIGIQYFLPLNEGYADILGTCVELALQLDDRHIYPAWDSGTGDWLIGEDSQLYPSSSNPWHKRNMRDPLNCGYQGYGTSLYYGTNWWADGKGGANGNGDAHVRGLICSHAFYLLSEGAETEKVNDTNLQHQYGPFRGLGITTTRRIMWGACFNGRLTEFGQGWKEARIAWIATARELGYDVGVVAQVEAAVGLIVRTVDTSEGGYNSKLPGWGFCDTIPYYDTTPDVPNHQKIQHAIDTADTGDLIYVYPGTYNEDINIPADKPDLTLVGQNRDITILNGTVTVNGSGFTMVGFTIDGQDTTYGIQCSTVVSISGNRIKNCDTGIYLNPQGYKSQVINNIFTDCDHSNLHYLGGGQGVISDNEFLDRGIKLTEFAGGNLLLRNLFDQITGHGIELYGGASPFIRHNYLKNISQNSIYGNTNTITLNENVLTSPSGVSFTLGTGTHDGNIFRNNFSAPSYSFSVDSTVLWDSAYIGSFWSNYTGQDTNYDSIGDTDLPHEGVDSFPLMYRPMSPFVFTYSDTIRMMSTVTGKDFMIRDTVTTDTTQSGLRFGSNASLDTNGKLQCSKFLAGSDKWMNTSGNLTGCFVWWNLEGKPVMCVDTAGVVRTSGFLTPKF